MEIEYFIGLSFVRQIFYLKSTELQYLTKWNSLSERANSHVDDILIIATDNLNGFTDTIENVFPQCHEKVGNPCEKLWNYYQSVLNHIRKGSALSKAYAL